jgi:hypothetical protein
LVLFNLDRILFDEIYDREELHVRVLSNFFFCVAELYELFVLKKRMARRYIQM